MTSNNTNASEKNSNSTQLDESLEVYNKKELDYLDRYLPMVRNAFDEDELYEIILDCEFDNKKIEQTINEKLRYLKFKGLQYGWNIVDSRQRVKPIDTADLLKKDKEEEKEKKKDKSYKKNKINREKRNSKAVKNDKYATYGNEGEYQEYEENQYENNNYYYNNKKKGNKSNYYNNYPTDYSGYDNQTYENYVDFYQDQTADTNYYGKGYKSARQKYNNYDSYGQQGYDYNSYNYNSYSGNDGYNNYDTNSYYKGGDYNTHKGYKGYTDYNSYNTYGGYDNYYNYKKNSTYQSKYKKKIRPNQNYKKNYQTNGFFVELKEYDPNFNKKIDEVPALTENIQQNTEEEVITHVDTSNLSQKIQSPSKIQKSPENLSPKNGSETIKDLKEISLEGETLKECESKPLNTEVSEEIEEINVNKTNIENLRSYFERLKQKTIFNETSNTTAVNGNPSANYDSGIYEKFSNFTGMNMTLPVFQSATLQHFNAPNEIEISSSGRSNNKNSMSKLLNNLSINNSQFLEITSNSTKMEINNDGKKISNFSLFFGGNEKKKEEPAKENKTALPVQPKPQVPQGNPYYPNPYPQYDYMSYQNAQRYANYPEHPYGTETPSADVYGQPTYEYPQYGYYQYPYGRMNPVGFPGYQNVSYPQYQERGAYPSTTPQEIYPQYPYGQTVPPQNSNLHYYHYPGQPYNPYANNKPLK